MNATPTDGNDESGCGRAASTYCTILHTSPAYLVDTPPPPPPLKREAKRNRIIMTTTTTTPKEEEQQQQELLEKVREAMRVEAALTSTMERVEPWLPSSIYDYGGGGGQYAATAVDDRPRVRPIPTDSSDDDNGQIRQVLASARVLAARTSAPAGWNPSAPVMGFSTPSPLPHQLRGGALAALQLERARKAERDKKRKRRLEERRRRQQQAEQEEREQKRRQSQIEERAAAAAAQEEEGGTLTPSRRDPKRREVVEHEKELDRDSERVQQQHRARQQQQQQAQQAQQRLQQQQQQDVSMNLSESSEDEGSDDDESD